LKREQDIFHHLLVLISLLLINLGVIPPRFMSFYLKEIMITCAYIWDFVKLKHL